MLDDGGAGILDAQSLVETVFALHVTAMRRIRQQQRDASMALLHQHVGRMAAGRPVVDVHRRQHHSFRARSGDHGGHIMLCKPVLHRRRGPKQHPRRRLHALREFFQTTGRFGCVAVRAGMQFELITAVGQQLAQGVQPEQDEGRHRLLRHGRQQGDHAGGGRRMTDGTAGEDAPLLVFDRAEDSFTLKLRQHRSQCRPTDAQPRAEGALGGQKVRPFTAQQGLAQKVGAVGDQGGSGRNGVHGRRSHSGRGQPV
jgi:hypothetical protein